MIEINAPITVPQPQIISALISTGQPGSRVEIQKGITHIQWRYAGEDTWTDLVALADLAVVGESVPLATIDIAGKTKPDGVTITIDDAGTISAVMPDLSGYVTTSNPALTNARNAADVHEWAKQTTKPGYNAAEVGLGNVNNTSDANKPISTATQTALNLKSDTATTYTKTETDSRIQTIVGTAPANLDTLQEIASQLATDESAVSALVVLVAGKEPAITSGTSSQYFRGDKTLATFPTSMPASDVSAWAKASTKPIYTYTEVGAAAEVHTHSAASITDFAVAALTAAPAETATSIKTALGISTLSGSNTGDQDLTGLVHSNRAALDIVSGVNTGNETAATIKTALGVTTLSGSNTGDQDLSGLVVNTRTINGHALTANVTVSAADVGAAELGVVQSWAKAQRGAVAPLTSVSGSIAIDISTSPNFSHSMTENTTLAAPSNAAGGQSGFILVTQHASAAKTLTMATPFWHPTTSAVPAISATLGSQSAIYFTILSPTLGHYSIAPVY